jgi:hypothetical protein
VIELSAPAFALQARAVLAANLDELAHVAMMLDRVELSEAEWRHVGAIILNRARCKAPGEVSQGVHRAYAAGSCAEVWPVSVPQPSGDMP